MCYFISQLPTRICTENCLIHNSSWFTYDEKRHPNLGFYFRTKRNIVNVPSGEFLKLLREFHVSEKYTHWLSFITTEQIRSYRSGMYSFPFQLICLSINTNHGCAWQRRRTQFRHMLHGNGRICQYHQNSVIEVNHRCSQHISGMTTLGSNICSNECGNWEYCSSCTSCFTIYN